MALKVRSDVLPYVTLVKSEGLADLSGLIRRVTGFPVQYNKAIVGRNAFSHESGIHQDGVLKHAETYEIMRPEMVGMQHSSLIIGKHSGRHAFRKKLEELGYEIDEASFEIGFQRFKELADRTKRIYDRNIRALFDEDPAHNSGSAQLASLTVRIGPFGAQRGTIQLEVDGNLITLADQNGLVDTLLGSIEALIYEPAGLQLNLCR